VIVDLPVPELRDYRRINAEIARHLDAGEIRVRLSGVEGQRLLLHGLAGPWDAIVEVEGDAGPELAAELDAPNLLVVCNGDAADGAGRHARGGRLLILGTAGTATAYGLRGGSVVAAQATGPRAGLNLAGGSLVLLGPAGQLAGERQPHAGRGRRGGGLICIRLAEESDPAGEIEPLRNALRGLEPWLGAGMSRWRPVDA